MASKTAIFKRVGIKTLLLTLIGLILALVGQKVAFADYSQLDDTSYTTFPQNYAIYQTFSGLSGHATNIRFTLENMGVRVWNDLKVWFNEANTATSTYSGTVIASSTWVNQYNKHFYDLELDYDLNPEKFYGLVIQDVYGDTRVYGSTNAESYPNGVCYDNPEPYGIVCDTAPDIYFILSIEPQNTIEIIFPENTTSTPDFNYWGLSGYALATSTLIHINWGISTSTWTGFTNYILDNAGGFSVSAPKSFTIPIGTYYAVAWLTTCPAPYDLYADCIPSTWDYPYGLGLLTPLATSTQISFTITGENPYTGGYYGTYWPTSTPISTSTSAEWVMTCDPNDPLWKNSLCQITKWTLEGIKGLLQFLFVPKQEDLAKFGELKSVLETKPPIGYFYAVKSALTGVGATSTPAFSLENASTTLAASIYNPLRNGITFILWLLFGFWIFNRIRNLAL